MKNFCFHLNRKLWVTMAVLLTLAFPSLAQKITVTGHVADELGEDLIGATIMEKGTTNGTSADIDGNFTINVPANATLVVSYVGYDPMDVAVNGQTHLNIVMKENAQMLAETVVIGYGSVKKSDATGSVAVITPDDVEAGISTSAQDLLVGASPGVTVTTAGGDPSGNATIRIRGGSSLSASNDPLIVIDGVPMTNQANAGGTNALTMVNPNNIESMTVLKDASATAIYGSRASNGVIIITTKKGKKGRPQVTFAANFHMNTNRKYLNMMESDEYLATMEKYASDRTKALLYANDLNANPGGDFVPYNTNWQKEVLRTTFSHDYSLSVGGSAGVVPYRVNASYTDNQGIVKTSSMQRTTVGFSLTPKFFEETLSINANASGSYVRTRNAPDVFGGAVALAPVYPVYMDYKMADPQGPKMFNGFYNIVTSGGDPQSNASQNPVQEILDQKNIGKTLSSNGNLQLDYALWWCRDLHFNLNLGYQVSKNNSQNVIAQNSIMAWRGNDLNGAGTIYKWYELQRNTLLDFYVNYKKDFEAIKSNLDVMVGYSWQRFDYHGNSYTHINSLGYDKNWGQIYQNGTYTLTEDPATADAVGKPFQNAPVSRWANGYQLVSFFGRLNYIFDDTYLLTFTLRDDGTSRFSKENRWGLFPSLALAWKINNMKFLEPAQGWLNDLKLRLGWGETGQQDLSGVYFPYIDTYTESYQNGSHYLNPANPVNADGTYNWINPFYPRTANPSLKWETTETWNVGIDMGVMNNRITLALDWYLRNTRDLLSYVPTAGVGTSNYQWRNIGNMRNIGIEATVTAKPVITDNFTWTTSYNVAWNRNEITKLQGGDMVAARALPGVGGANIQYHIVGEPAFTYMVYEQVFDQNGDPIPGQYVDQNADGAITEADLIKYHTPTPDVTMTWNNNFSWKNWDLSFTLRANINNYVYNNIKRNNTNLYERAAAQYQLSNLLSGEFLFNSADSNIPQSSYWIDNASFIRCDNITLGYTWPTLGNTNMGLRIFAAVQNPFVITGFSGMDPEQFDGIESSPYPRPITTTLGLVFNF